MTLFDDDEPPESHGIFAYDLVTEDAVLPLAHEEHFSLKCKLYGRHSHKPCSGTCDGMGSGEPCEMLCECWCHNSLWNEYT